MGSVNLDNTGSGSAITLSSDGTNLLLDGTAIGGGGGDPDLYRDNASSATTPVASGANAVAIGTQAEATGIGSIALGIDATSTTTNTVAIGNYTDATQVGSVAIGYSAQSAGTNAMSLGRSYASGTDSFAAAIANNTASYGALGANSISMGNLSKATGSNSVCFSNTSTASGSNSAVLGGSSGTASSSGSVVLGGSSNVADGQYSTAKGYYGNTNGVRLKHATGVYPNQQGAYYVLGHSTSDATPIALNTSVWTPSATNQIALPNNSAYTFSGTIVGKEKASEGTDVGAWEVKGIIRREANAGTTVLVNSVINELNAPTGWAVALTADTTFGCLKVEATGVASTNIRWVATIQTSEVTYA